MGRRTGDMLEQRLIHFIACFALRRCDRACSVAGGCTWLEHLGSALHSRQNDPTWTASVRQAHCSVDIAWTHLLAFYDRL